MRLKVLGLRNFNSSYLLVCSVFILFNLIALSLCSDNKDSIQNSGNRDKKEIVITTSSSSSKSSRQIDSSSNNNNRPWTNKVKPLEATANSNKGSIKLVRRIVRKNPDDPNSSANINIVNRSLYNRLLAKKRLEKQEKEKAQRRNTEETSSDSDSGDQSEKITEKTKKKDGDMLLIPVPESQRVPYHPVIIQKKEKSSSAEKKSTNADPTTTTYKLNKMFVPLGIYGKVVKNLENIRNTTNAERKKKSKGSKKSKSARARDFEFDPTGLLTRDYKGNVNQIFLTSTSRPFNYLEKIDMTTSRAESLDHTYDQWKGVLNPPLPNEKNTYNPTNSNPGMISKFISKTVSNIPGMIYNSMAQLTQLKSPFEPEESDQKLFPKVPLTPSEGAGLETLEYFRKRPHLVFKQERALKGFVPVTAPSDQQGSKKSKAKSRALEQPQESQFHSKTANIQETDESFNAKWREIANKYSLEELTMARNRIFDQVLNKDDETENRRVDKPQVKEDRGTVQDYYFDLMSLKSPTTSKVVPEASRVNSAFEELLHLFRFSVKAEKMHYPGPAGKQSLTGPSKSSHDQVSAGSDFYEAYGHHADGPPAALAEEDQSGWRPIISNVLNKAMAQSPIPIPSMFHFKAGVSYPKNPTLHDPSPAIHDVHDIHHGGEYEKSSSASNIISSSLVSSTPSRLRPVSSLTAKYASYLNKNPDIEIIPSSEFYKMNLDTHSIAAVIRPPGMSDDELRSELAPVFSGVPTGPSTSHYSGHHYTAPPPQLPQHHQHQHQLAQTQTGFNLPTVIDYSPIQFSNIMNAINSGVKLNPGAAQTHYSTSAAAISTNAQKPGYQSPVYQNPTGPVSSYQLPSNIDPDIASLIRAELEKDDVPQEYRQDFSSQQSQPIASYARPIAQKPSSPRIDTPAPLLNVKFHKPIPLIVTERAGSKMAKGKKKKMPPKGQQRLMGKGMPKYVVDLAKKLKNEKDVQGIVRVSRIVNGVVKEYLYPVRG